ncbi:MAG: MaoC family dehydratase [Anaerolineae bacterium]|nr:MaoC family dehydratase [Anaerolineae bacterium]
MALSVGDKASRSKTFGDEDVRGFAQISGDTNPVHLDDAYAAQTRFGRRLVHGMLTASLLSATLANDLPGEGTIYMSQTLQFKAPVFIGDTITATVEVTAYRADRRIATLATTCVNQDGVVVVQGEAVVLAPHDRQG